MPATFPQTECFVAWTYTGSDYLSLDPLTGAVLNRRQERKTDVREFPAWLGPEHGLRTLVNEKGRLIATNPSTGTTNWISSSETVVFQYHTLPSGLVCVTPMTNDMRVLDLRSGKEVIRVLDSISETYFTRDIVNAVCLCGMSGDSTSQQVTVYSPAGGAPIYRGTNSVHVDQLISLRPALSNLLLVAPRSGSDLPLRVVNERGEEVNGWRLPKPADRRYAERCFPRPYFTPDEIVVFDEAGWDILVYEHDPAADGKPPDGKGTR
jgi:hypothetical protein